MSNPESFIDEVTEEVRRDQLYASLRKYGWIGALAVILIVGGAAFNEWSKARAAGQAEAAGDAILKAAETGEAEARVAALEAIPSEGVRSAVVALIAAAEDEDPSTAAARLEDIAQNTALPALYRDLAQLKRAMLAGGPVPAADRIAALTALTVPGNPLRVLAEEQVALAELETGDSGAGLARLQALLTDDEASEALRRRASQLIVALGGAPGGA